MNNVGGFYCCPTYIRCEWPRTVCFEVEKSRAWTSEPVDVIQRSALERLKKQEWDDVRPALSVVVRFVHPSLVEAPC